MENRSVIGLNDTIDYDDLVKSTQSLFLNNNVTLREINECRRIIRDTRIEQESFINWIKKHYRLSLKNC